MYSGGELIWDTASSLDFRRRPNPLRLGGGAAKSRALPAGGKGCQRDAMPLVGGKGFQREPIPIACRR